MVALAAIAEMRPGRMLEAGCGTGDFAALLTAPNVRCVDLSPAAVEAARERGLGAHVADVQRLPIPDDRVARMLGSRYILRRAEDYAFAAVSDPRDVRRLGLAAAPSRTASAPPRACSLLATNTSLRASRARAEIAYGA